VPCLKCGRKRIVSVVAENFLAPGSAAQWHSEIAGDETKSRSMPNSEAVTSPCTLFTPAVLVHRISGIAESCL
jgi:hypothetical protein